MGHYYMKTSAEIVEERYAAREMSRRKNHIRRSGLRAEIFLKCGGHCWWCAKQLHDSWHVDHLIPVSAQGQDTYENLVAACQRCNLSRGTKSADAFAKISIADLF